jgi:hypothetical protein
MQWLLHGNVSGAAAEALRRFEHQTHKVDELKLSSPDDLRELLKAAQTKQWDVLTTDSSLVNAIYDDKIWFNRSVVYLQLTGEDVEQDDAIDRLFARYKRLTPGRLYTVTESRVKIRQLPASKR